MHTRSALWIGLWAFLPSTSFGADVAEAYRQAWRDAAPQIEANIERYRKADATIELRDAAGKPLAGATVSIAQQTHEFLFGCNLFALDQLSTPELNRKYEAAFAGLFNFATVPFYWRELEPADGKLRFAADSPPIWRRPPPDRLVAWCRAHGIVPKGHALMYVKSKFMPDWIDPKNPQRLKELGERHMAEIARRYGGDIPIWDVVNEEVPRLRRPNEWHAVPDDYLAWCFRTAAGLLPAQSKLLINDGTHEVHDNSADYEKQIASLIDRKVRLDGIGIQFHAYNRGGMLGGKVFPPAQLQAAYQRLGRFGLPLYITEITVPGTGDNGPALQAQVVENLYRLWFSTPDMAGLTWWNLADGTAYENENKALGGLLDKDMNPKPAYTALKKLVDHDWKTNLTATTDAAGRIAFRGFRGQYQVRVSAGGKTETFTAGLTKAGPHTISLTLKP